VLELGCGDAGNLVPMAVALPAASFVGVDAAPGAIARGRQLVAALGLDNVTLEARALEDFAAPPAGFDFVIAHGVY
jgi:cyclopropane fatty-acyl-phospholipid synthase-like methyltransferase